MNKDHNTRTWIESGLIRRLIILLLDLTWYRVQNREYREQQSMERDREYWDLSWLLSLLCTSFPLQFCIVQASLVKCWVRMWMWMCIFNGFWILYIDRKVHIRALQSLELEELRRGRGRRQKRKRWWYWQWYCLFVSLCVWCVVCALNFYVFTWFGLDSEGSTYTVHSTPHLTWIVCSMYNRTSSEHKVNVRLFCWLYIISQYSQMFPSFPHHEKNYVLERRWRWRRWEWWWWGQTIRIWISTWTWTWIWILGTTIQIEDDKEMDRGNGRQKQLDLIWLVFLPFSSGLEKQLEPAFACLESRV